MTRKKRLVCGDCGGEVRSRLVHHPQRTGGFALVEHWWCVAEVEALKAARSRMGRLDEEVLHPDTVAAVRAGRPANPKHRVQVEVGFVDRSPIGR